MTSGDGDADGTAGRLRQREGDQPLPVPGSGPLMHDLLVEDLRRGFPDDPALEGLCADVMARQQLGIERYGRPLQAHNGRDALRDTYEELIDFLVYAIQGREEGLPGIVLLTEVYFTVLHVVLKLRAFLDGRPGYHGEGQLADFDPGTGRSSADDWLK